LEEETEEMEAAAQTAFAQGGNALRFSRLNWRRDAPQQARPAGAGAVESGAAAGAGPSAVEARKRPANIFEELGAPPPDMSRVALPPEGRTTIFDVQLEVYEQRDWERPGAYAMHVRTG
jgi:hypothetical protein